MKAYSMDLRNRVLADCDAGMEARQVAVKYNVSESWIKRLRQRRRESGETAPRRPKTSPPKWQLYADSIEQFVTDQPDATLAELKEHLEIPLSIPTLSQALIALRFTLKKSLPRGGTGPAGRRQPTRDWRKWQSALSPEDMSRFVFIDETWASTNMSRRYGRSRKGQRLIGAVPHGHWKTTTFVAALRLGDSPRRW